MELCIGRIMTSLTVLPERMTGKNTILKYLQRTTVKQRKKTPRSMLASRRKF